MVQALGRTERERVLEMRRAREIQRTLLGDRSLRVNGCSIQAVFLPTATVGGDFFDMVPMRDGSTLVAVIDVTGHGVPGALCTALLRSSLRHLTRTTCDVAEIMRGLNQDLCDVAAAGVFATAVLVKLGPDSGEIQYANAGHDSPLLIAPDGGVTALNHAGLMLGVEPDANHETIRADIVSGSRLFVVTDGLHEATSPRGEQFGRERLSEALSTTGRLPLEAQLHATINRGRAFCGQDDFEDDVTLLGICWADAREVAGSSVPAAGLRG